MPTRVTVSLPDQARDYANELVDRGAFTTVSAAMTAGLQALRERDEEHRRSVDALADEIRRRAELPDAEYVEHKAGDFVGMFNAMRDGHRE